MSAKLSPAQCAHIHQHETCPDCETGFLLEGPRALGINANVKCANPRCRHEFCITIWHGTVVSGERIDRDEPRLYKDRIVIRENTKPRRLK